MAISRLNALEMAACLRCQALPFVARQPAEDTEEEMLDHLGYKNHSHFDVFTVFLWREAVQFSFVNCTDRYHFHNCWLRHLGPMSQGTNSLTNLHQSALAQAGEATFWFRLSTSRSTATMAPVEPCLDKSDVFLLDLHEVRSCHWSHFAERRRLCHHTF